MLKIKDDVDLKELEKFGFVERENVYIKGVMTDRGSGFWTYYESIVINKKERLIYSILYNDQMNMEWESYNIRKDHYIQDLVEANLVEKVKEK